MMKNLSYRNVKENDFEEICTFPQNKEELFFMFPRTTYPLTIDKLELAVKNRFDSTVILLDEKIVGFANFYEVKEDHYCSIGNVIINPKHRGLGIGEFLIKTMEHTAINKYNVSELHLSCFNTNTNGILLYSKLDYKPYEIEKWINEDGTKFALIKLKKIV
ncbi:MAG: GNAT family N-acetyltransferase [Dysgonomonas sp.]|nr:GNAT family N-acetyltransferase [Dysgonomonas sp.]